MGEHKNRPPFGAQQPALPPGGKDLTQLTQEAQQERILKAALSAAKYGPDSSYLLKPLNGWVLVEKLPPEETRGDSKVILPQEFPIFRILALGDAPFAASGDPLWEGSENHPLGPVGTLIVINGMASLHMYRGETFMYIMYHQAQLAVEPKAPASNSALS